MLRLTAAALLLLPAAVTAQVSAQRAQQPPIIDGRADDAVWARIPASSDFVAFRPTEGAQPTYRTDMKVAFDDRTLFVLVRAHDPRPDSIIGLLSRRDVFGPPNDLIQLYIDSYHDGRTGFEYVVNPAGVKADFLLFDDDRFDLSWDGIWDVATRVDSAGWVAEFAIPFSQLRFRGGSQSTFGVMAWRTIGRLGERASWPAYRPSRSGLVSQFGQIDHLQLPSAMRLEGAPYFLSRGRNIPPVGAGAATRTETNFAIGGDVKFGPTPTVTFDATLNPDFGQIESDPAVLNLSSVETFLPERRPFFLEGIGLFRFTLSRDPNSPEGLFYTRRIGRRPQLYDSYSDVDTPQETTILGAGKLVARIGRTASLASLAAVTSEELGRVAPAGGRYQIEPRTTYGVTRLQKDYRGGRSGIGFMATGVRRDLDGLTALQLPRQAVTGGFSTQHQSRDGQYWARLWAVASKVEGSAPAIARLQLSPVHAFQRPDDGLKLDTLRTSLRGAGGQLWLGKTGGVVRYGSSLRYLSPNFDPLDIGYTREVDHTSWVLDAGLFSTKATRWYRSANVSLVRIGWWSGSGKIDDQLWVNTSVELPSQWRVNFNNQGFSLFNSVCAQACTRGGPAVKKDPIYSSSLQLSGDARARVAPDFFISVQRGDGGRTRYARFTPAILWRAASNLQVTTDVTLEDLTNGAQFYRRFGVAASDTSHYTVATLVQSTRSLTMRMSYAATPTLSVEWYAQPFVSKGTYSNVRELDSPRADAFDQRYKPYVDAAVTATPGGVDFRQLRSNLVTRWEYRPGSVVYVVWSQGRDLFNNAPGTFRFSRDSRDLFELPPKNTIAIKASYWMGK
jgi:hypothetical protein